MRVTVVQMNPGADKAANLAQLNRLAEGAIAADHPELAASLRAFGASSSAA